MPIYEYQCQGCQANFELLVRGSEKPACPTCESPKVEKQLSIIASPNMKEGSELCAPQPMPGGG